MRRTPLSCQSLDGFISAFDQNRKKVGALIGPDPTEPIVRGNAVAFGRRKIGFYSRRNAQRPFLSRQALVHKLLRRGGSLAVRRGGVGPRVSETAEAGACLALTASSTFNRSRVERARRSSLVTSSTSPACNLAINLASSLRLIPDAPESFSVKILAAPALASASL
jgi:hypothetical protein